MIDNRDKNEINKDGVISYKYSTPGKTKGVILVRFYLESKKDKRGNTLSKINAVDSHGVVSMIPYKGSTLMITVETGKNTVMIREAKRSDLSKFAKAFEVFIRESNEFDVKKLYQYLGEKPSEQDLKADKKKEEDLVLKAKEAEDLRRKQDAELVSKTEARLMERLKDLEIDRVKKEKTKTNTKT